MDLNSFNRAGAALTDAETASAASLLGGAASLILATIDPATPDRARVLTITPSSVQLADGPPPEHPAVTLLIDQATSAALDEGILTPAAAITEGRARIAGDAAVLVAAFSLLSAVLARAATA